MTHILPRKIVEILTAVAERAGNVNHGKTTRAQMHGRVARVVGMQIRTLLQKRTALGALSELTRTTVQEAAANTTIAPIPQVVATNRTTKTRRVVTAGTRGGNGSGQGIALRYGQWKRL